MEMYNKDLRRLSQGGVLTKKGMFDLVDWVKSIILRECINLTNC